MDRGKQIIELTKRIALCTRAPQELKLTFDEYDDLRIAVSLDEAWQLTSTEDRTNRVFGKLYGATLKWAE